MRLGETSAHPAETSQASVISLACFLNVGTEFMEEKVGLGNTTHTPGWAPSLPQSWLHLEGPAGLRWARKWEAESTASS